MVRVAAACPSAVRAHGVARIWAVHPLDRATVVPLRHGLLSGLVVDGHAGGPVR